jgi:hypothetical protein
MSRVNATHILHLSVGSADKAAVEELIQLGVDQAQVLFPKASDIQEVKWEVNYVTGRFNVAFVWVELVPDEMWVPSSPPKERKSLHRWGDDEVEEAPPMMKKPLPSLLQLGEHGFAISRSFIITSPEVAHHRLICVTAPSWITREHIATYFDKFNTAPAEVKSPPRKKREQGWEKVKKEKKTLTFPIITIRDSTKTYRGQPLKIVNVIFSDHGPSAYDAGFALQMRRNFAVTRGEQSTRLIFDYYRPRSS